MTRKTPQRADLETPHRREYIRSNESRAREGIMPETLSGLLRWYEQAWWYEVPDRLHGRGVWKSGGDIVRGIPTEDGYHGEPMKRERIPGGSRLGTPTDGDAFRRYIEDSPKARDPDGYYLRPLAAAFCGMAYGEGRKIGRPFVSRWLFLVARAGFDWHRAAVSAGKTSDEAELLTHKGLEILWAKYAEYPRRERTEAA